MDCEAVFVQPLAPVPVTVYEVVEVGDTVVPAVFEPLLQTYVEAPLAVNVVEPAIQIVEVPEIVTVGTDFIVTNTSSVSGQPFALVPVTV